MTELAAPAPATREAKCFRADCETLVSQSREGEFGLWLPKYCSAECSAAVDVEGRERLRRFAEARAEHNLKNNLAASNVRPEISAGSMTLDGLPALYAATRKAGGVEPERYREIVQLVKDFVKVPPLLRDAGVASILYIHGPAGVGKSVLLEAAIGYVVRELRREAMFTSPIELWTDITSTFGAEREETTARVLRRLTEIPLLGIDDVDRKPTASEWELAILLQVADERYRHSRPTIYNANRSVKELFTLWSDENDPRRTQTVRLLCDRLSDTKRALSVAMKGTSLRREA